MKCIVLAAGKSRRMTSNIPKWAMMLHYSPMIKYILRTLEELNIKTQVCIREEYKEYANFEYYYQIKEYNDTFGPIASYNFDDNEDYLILHSDMPLISKELLLDFINSFSKSNKSSGIVISKTKGNYHSVKKVKNHLLFRTKGKNKNMGIYIFKGYYLNNEKRKHMTQYEFTIPEMLSESNDIPYIHIANYNYEFLNINNRKDLMKCGSIIKELIKEKIIPYNQVLDYENTIIDYFTEIKNSTIYPNTRIIDSIIEASTIYNNTVIENAKIGINNEIGPFIKIKDSFIKENNTLGNFVEINRSSIGTNNMIKHHSYLGDTIIKDNNNIGAMVVFSNYNGRNKFESKVGSNNFIGSFSSIIAPISIGNNNYISAMCKINKDVSDNRFIKEEHNIENRENTFIHL